MEPVRHFANPPHQVASKIADICLDSVRQKLEQNWIWRWWYNTKQVEAEYRKFLYLIGLFPEEIIVPWAQEIDTFWHQHILDTKKYQEDCEVMFGKMLHHNPHLGNNTTRHVEAIKRTKQLYQQTFPTEPVCTYDSSCGGAACGAGCGGCGGH